MLCGFICSGKTTLARKLERDLKAITFCPDEWMVQLFGQEHSDQCGIRYAPAVRSLMTETYEQLLKLKIDVILDDGFWRKADRDHLRKRAAELGAQSKLYFLVCPKDILMQGSKKEMLNANAILSLFLKRSSRIRGNILNLQEIMKSLSLLIPTHNHRLHRIGRKRGLSSGDGPVIDSFAAYLRKK
jgi:predicted kinase